MATAFIFTAATLYAYLFKKSLSTVGGRCEFMMLLGILIFQVASYRYQRDYYGIIQKILFNVNVTAYMMIFLWIFMMILDIWSTFR